MIKYNRWFFGVIIVLIVCSLSACSRHPSREDEKMLTVKSSTLNDSLFYSGNVRPLKTLVITSSVDGVIVDMPAQYGEAVTQGQLLFIISSAKFLMDYKTALTAYVKAKSDFNNSQTQLTESKFLHKNQLVSDDDLKLKQSNYYTAQLALLQAKDSLQNLLHQSDMRDINLQTLSIADIDKISKAMHLQKKAENIRIIAEGAGTLLAPNKNGEENKRIQKGDVVKQGDVLGIIGDMSGISVQIKVNELTVNQLKVGQPVKVTGIAFPDDILTGEIERVDRQGESNMGGLPLFTVEVIVPTLTELQKKAIHVGMSAKVEVNTNEDTQLLVPFTAVYEKNGISYVKRYDAKTKKTQGVAVKTGKTSMESVVILSGLKEGDKIVLPH